jgi:hypothetical protein
MHLQVELSARNRPGELNMQQDFNYALGKPSQDTSFIIIFATTGIEPSAD